MVDKVRVIAIGGTIGALVAGGIVAPAFLQNVLADEPAKLASSSFTQMFQAPHNLDDLVKFDITVGPDVSTTANKTAIVSKISFGHREYVSIVTTPSGTYSSDALTSPNVRYPGIDVAPKDDGDFSQSYASFSSPYGSGSWTSITRGSITYFTYSVERARRS